MPRTCQRARPSILHLGGSILTHVTTGLGGHILVVFLNQHIASCRLDVLLLDGVAAVVGRTEESGASLLSPPEASFAPPKANLNHTPPPLFPYSSIDKVHQMKSHHYGSTLASILGQSCRHRMLLCTMQISARIQQYSKYNLLFGHMTRLSFFFVHLCFSHSRPSPCNAVTFRVLTNKQ